MPFSVKKFWFIASMLEPRFKKLTFDGDRMLKPSMRRDAVKWLTEEYNSKWKHKVYNPTKAAAAPTGEGDTGDARDEAADSSTPHVKRRKVSSSSFFAPRGKDKAGDSPAPPTPTDKNEDKPHADELIAYLALPQLEGNEWAGLQWWEDNAAKFPNLAVMARQYLGCPATSATVERLFSQVGICFSDKRKSATAEKLQDVLFTKLNVE